MPAERKRERAVTVTGNFPFLKMGLRFVRQPHSVVLTL